MPHERALCNLDPNHTTNAMRFLALLVAIAVLQGPPAAAQDAQRQSRAYPPDMPGAKVETYKTVGDTKLKLYVFQPDGWKPD